MSNANAISPMVEIDLSEVSADDKVLAITEHAFLGHVNLRGASDNAKFTAAAKKALGAELPTQANTFLVAGENRKSVV